MSSIFYTSVFPPFGLRVLSVFKNGLNKAPVHEFFDNNEDLIEAADTYNQLGKNVYHGCAVYETNSNRKGENVKAAKSLWLDLDVGPSKPYATKKDAAAHFEQFRTALGLPESHIVDSGNGIHEYLPFVQPIAPDQWARLAGLFAACLDHYGIKHDPTRTQDRASILRIPNTHNHKASPAKAVTLKRVGTEAPAKELWVKLKAYADANLIPIGQPKSRAKGKNKETNDLVGIKEYPPSFAENIVKHCPTLKEVDDTGGDVPYDVWWRAMGVAKFAEKSEEVAIHWTRNRASTGHSKSDAIGTIEGWGADGPPLCAKFAAIPDSKDFTNKCADCPNKTSNKSPVQLGYDEQPVIEPSPPKDEPPELDANGNPVRKWGFDYDWIREERGHRTHTGVINGQMTMSVQDEGGAYIPKAFCNRYWQVLQRVRSVDGTYKLEIGYATYPGKPHKTFTMDSADVTASDALRREFSARELHLYGGPRAVKKAQDLIMTDQDILMAYNREAEVHDNMGWVTHGNTVNGALTGEFVLGTTKFAPKVPPVEIVLAEDVPIKFREDFGTKGSTAGWVNIVDRVYNRRGAEAYQFVICAMLAAPLVRLTPGAGEWHGIPVVLGGDSGAAKTSTALVAASIYSSPQTLKFSCAVGVGGDTQLALAIKMGALRNLPYIMDEMSGQTADYINSVLYMTSNGTPKDGATVTGTMRRNKARWDSIGVVTANDNMHEVLEGGKNANIQDAGKYRSFPIKLSRDDLTRVFEGVNKADIEDDLLGNHYGCMGRDWIQFLVNNRVKVEDMIGKMRRTYVVSDKDMSSMRFYKDLLLMVKIAATLARHKGWIHWDVDQMMKWAETHAANLVEGIVTKDWDGRISDFIASLHGRTIVTHSFREGRGRRHDIESPMDQIPGTVIPVARRALEDKRFFVTASALREWCQKIRIMPSDLIQAMIEKGYVKTHVDADGNLVADCNGINIGGGTTMPRPRSPCYEFVYSAVIPDGSDAPVEGSSPDQSVTDLVTDGVDELEVDM